MSKQSLCVVALAVALSCEACGSTAQGTSAGVSSEGLQSYVQHADDDHDQDSPRRSERRRSRRWRRSHDAPAEAGSGGQSSSEQPQTGSAGRPAGNQGGAAGQVVGGRGGSGGTAGQAVAGQGGIGGAAGQPEPVHYRPQPGVAWQYQLSGALDSSVPADLFDIDLYETTSAQIAELHAAGRKVVCYFDTAYEPNRPDSAALEPYRGNPVDGWPGQYWLDVRAQPVLDVMLARTKLASEKGCDGVEADDVDSRSNDPGFPITALDQQRFVIALASAAHTRGLAFGLKNALEDVPALVSYADFAINEECFAYDECSALSVFIQAGKPVLQVEYAKTTLEELATEICPAANALNFDTLIKNLDLDAPRRACR